jgi:hypothetical protein
MLKLMHALAALPLFLLLMIGPACTKEEVEEAKDKTADAAKSASDTAAKGLEKAKEVGAKIEESSKEALAAAKVKSAELAEAAKDKGADFADAVKDRLGSGSRAESAEHAAARRWNESLAPLKTKLAGLGITVPELSGDPNADKPALVAVLTKIKTSMDGLDRTSRGLAVPGVDVQAPKVDAIEQQRVLLEDALKRIQPILDEMRAAK